MSVTRIHHVQVSVPRGSEDAVRAFYCGILGLTEDDRPALHFGTEDVADRAASKRHVAFEVDDLDAVRARLRNAGVHTEDGIPIPGLRRFECRDPFGNRLELLSRVA